jgi:serine/threonine-protein kinase
LFTGKRVFEAGSLEELKRMHESSAPANPSSWVKDLDPLVERVILRCLEKDPAKRLASAKQVADALPGGDPLAAALAMGETPSPEMVAAAGQKTGMKPLYAVLCLAAIIVGLITRAALGDKISPFPSLLREHSPEELTHKARDLTRQLGYTERPADSAFGFQGEWAYQDYVDRNIVHDKQREQFTKVMAPISYWYRQSPQYLKPWMDGWVYDSDPPQDTSGMIGVWLDLQGRLTRFEAVPPQLDQATDVPPPPDWKPLFTAAGLDPANFVSTAPQWMPLAGFDARAAWTGTHPAQSQIPLRIEAAAYRGKPVYFHLIWPWTLPTRMPAHQTTMGQQIGGALILVTFCALTLGALLLVRYNFRHDRGDQRGAFRMATFIFIAKIGTWLFGAHHGPSFDILLGFFMHAVRDALFWAGFAWALYIALEPYVRRRWPVVLISWNRLLSGKLRDPLVGRDLLIGILFAVVGRQTIGLLRALFFNWDVDNMSNFARDSLPSLRFLIASGFSNVNLLTLVALIFLFLLFVLRTLTRRQWLTAIIFIFLGCLLGLQQSDNPLVGALFNGLNFLLIVVIMLRFGFFAFAVNATIGGFLSYPMTLHFSAWYTNSALLLAGVILALAIYAFYTSLGGQKVFTGKLLEE